MSRARATIEDAYPLHWPDGVTRTHVDMRQRSRFKVANLGSARDDLIHELRLLGAQYVVLSTNAPVRHDGLPYANGAEPDDPGAVAYFTLDDDSRAMACDRWDRLRDNVSALAHTISALRGIDRWGGSDMVKRAFSAFVALPPAGHDWPAVLGVRRTDPFELVKGHYLHLAAQHHPDRGGDAVAMAKVNEAWAAYRREAGR